MKTTKISPAKSGPSAPITNVNWQRHTPPTISPASALNRLSKWMKLNLELDEALRHTGYKGSQKIFTSLQVELIFRYLGKP